jgi:hypothetical protein
MDAIREAARLYRQEVFRRGGSIVISRDQTVTQTFVNLDLAGLLVEELQELGYVLMHMSRNPGMNAIIENDHLEYWAYVALRTSTRRSQDGWIERHNPVFSLFDSLIMNELQPQYADSVNRRYQNRFLQEQFFHAFFPAVWSGFAYLEGVCRRLCHDYVDVDGQIKKSFKVCRIQYRSPRGNRAAKRSRGKQGRPGKQGQLRINNLSHILLLTRRRVKPRTRRILTKFFRDYSPEQIFQWRNDCLHGAEDSSTTVIVLYCLIAVLLLDVH